MSTSYIEEGKEIIAASKKLLIDLAETDEEIKEHLEKSGVL
tara:strand:+ start:329 stop:451 length:123 start_codon:yes stop_codon:yes gene_type:complete